MQPIDNSFGLYRLGFQKSSRGGPCLGGCLQSLNLLVGPNSKCLIAMSEEFDSHVGFLQHGYQRIILYYILYIYIYICVCVCVWGGGDVICQIRSIKCQIRPSPQKKKKCQIRSWYIGIPNFIYLFLLILIIYIYIYMWYPPIF